MNTVKLFGISFKIIAKGNSIFIEPKYKYDYSLTEFQQNKLLEIQNRLFNKFSYNYIDNQTLNQFIDEFNELANEIKLKNEYSPGNYQAELNNELEEKLIKEKL